jgi:hypothetical protein
MPILAAAILHSVDQQRRLDESIHGETCADPFVVRAFWIANRKRSGSGKDHRTDHRLEDRRWNY